MSTPDTTPTANRDFEEARDQEWAQYGDELEMWGERDAN